MKKTVVKKKAPMAKEQMKTSPSVKEKITKILTDEVKKKAKTLQSKVKGKVKTLQSKVKGKVKGKAEKVKAIVKNADKKLAAAIKSKVDSAQRSFFDSIFKGPSAKGMLLR